MLNHAATRFYFEDEPANADDPFLARVPAHRRSTLLAKRELVDGAVTYRLDIVLQGEAETAFFNL
jgi:protocatechuate 3,4-dioxygenase alpha subunit